jgi:hypothetical protein
VGELQIRRQVIRCSFQYVARLRGNHSMVGTVNIYTIAKVSSIDGHRLHQFRAFRYPKSFSAAVMMILAERHRWRWRGLYGWT